jgi:hypothetical protein
MTALKCDGLTRCGMPVLAVWAAMPTEYSCPFCAGHAHVSGDWASRHESTFGAQYKPPVCDLHTWPRAAPLGYALSRPEVISRRRELGPSKRTQRDGTARANVHTGV